MSNSDKASLPAHVEHDPESIMEKPPTDSPAHDVVDHIGTMPWQTWLVIFACALWNAAFACFQTTCLFWSAPMIASLGGGAEQLWLGQSFQLVTAAVGPILARLGDNCGRRYLVLFGISGGAVGGIVMATANSFGALVAGTTVFGLSYGSAGNIYAIPSEILPRAHRGTGQLISFAGSVIGALLGLFLIADFIVNEPGGFEGWRTACWFNFALHASTFLFFTVFYFPKAPDNPDGLTLSQKIMKTDWVGCAILAAGVTPLMMGIIWGGVVYAWNSAAVVSCLVVGIAFLFFVLPLHQFFVKKDGLCSHALFKNRNFAICLCAIFVEGFIYNIVTHYVGVVTSVLWDARPFMLALRFSAFLFCALAFAPLYGLYVFRFRDAKAVLIVGFCLFLVGIIGLATIKVGTNHPAIFYTAIAGGGFAAPLVFLTMVTQLAVEPMLIGLATSLVTSSRAVGGALGIAISGAVFNSKANVKIPAYILSAALKAGIPSTSLTAFIEAVAGGDAATALSLPGSSDAAVAAATFAYKHAFVDSARYVFIVAIPFVVVGLMALLLLRSTKKEMNHIVDRALNVKQRHT